MPDPTIVFTAPPTTPEYCLLWVDWWPLCMSKTEWSGWMQALGSIAAILIAWRSVRSQIQHAQEGRRKDREDREKAVLRLVAGLAGDATRALRHIAQLCNERWLNGGRLRLGSERLDEVREAIRSVPVVDLPEDALTHFFAIRRVLAYSARSIRLLNSADEVSEARAASAADYAAQVGNARRQIRRILRELESAAKP